MEVEGGRAAACSQTVFKHDQMSVAVAAASMSACKCRLECDRRPMHSVQMKVHTDCNEDCNTSLKQYQSGVQSAMHIIRCPPSPAQFMSNLCMLACMQMMVDQLCPLTAKKLVTWYPKEP